MFCNFCYLFFCNTWLFYKVVFVLYFFAQKINTPYHRGSNWYMNMVRLFWGDWRMECKYYVYVEFQLQLHSWHGMSHQITKLCSQVLKSCTAIHGNVSLWDFENPTWCEYFALLLCTWLRFRAELKYGIFLFTFMFTLISNY